MRKKIIQSNEKHARNVEALLQKLSKYTDEELNRKPADGGWSAMQTAWHVMLAEETSYLYVQKKLGYGGEFEKSGFKAKWNTFVLSVFLALPLKYKAPATSSGENLPKHATFAELKSKWDPIRKSWADFLSQMPEDLLDKAVFKHPRIGRIGWNLTIDFFATHLGRHKKQIQRALA